MKKKITGLVVVAIVALFAGFVWSEELKEANSHQHSGKGMVAALSELEQDTNAPSEEEVVQEEALEGENQIEEMPEEGSPAEGDSEEKTPDEEYRKE